MSLYHQCLPFLGPLISRTPFKEFQKSPPLPSDFRLSYFIGDKGHRRFYTLESLSIDYNNRLVVSWLHSPVCFWYSASDYAGQFSRFHNSTHPNGFLDETKLFCARYIDDYDTCRAIARSAANGHAQCEYNDDEAIKTLSRIESSCDEKNLLTLLKKGCIMGTLHFLCFVIEVGQQRISARGFQSFFKLQSWKDLWEPSELGRLFSLGLSQYGPNAVEGTVEPTFKSTRDCLLWLFLGAHHWFHVDHRIQPWNHPDAEPDNKFCCSQVPHGGETEYVKGLISRLSVEDRSWLVEQLIRHADEFGVCRDLGANIFNYLVVIELNDVDFWLCKLLEEIFCSRLQYVFEYAIGMGISEYNRKNEVCFGSRSKFETSRRHLDRLLRKDTDLYKVLKLSAQH